MRLHEFEHILRAAGKVVNEDVVAVVIGSQAILAPRPTPPEKLKVTAEVDCTS